MIGDVHTWTVGEAGKGSRQRKCNQDKFNENFDRIFGSKKPKAGKWVYRDGKRVEVK